MDPSTDAADQFEAAIRDHDVDENGDCAACRRAGVIVEYPCRVRLVIELVSDQLPCRHTRHSATTEENIIHG